MGITEVVPGRLRGMGWNLECALLVSRDQRGSRRCTVLHAPDWLPDGYYEASFRGQSAFLQRKQSAWSIGIAWAEMPSRRKAARAAEPQIAEWMRSRIA